MHLHGLLWNSFNVTENDVEEALLGCIKFYPRINPE
jgi:hypothetical protein